MNSCINKIIAHMCMFPSHAAAGHIPFYSPQDRTVYDLLATSPQIRSSTNIFIVIRLCYANLRFSLRNLWFKSFYLPLFLFHFASRTPSHGRPWVWLCVCILWDLWVRNLILVCFVELPPFIGRFCANVRIANWVRASKDLADDDMVFLRQNKTLETRS